MTKKTFPNLSPHAYQHPLDRTAILALGKVAGLDWVVRKFISTIGERRLRLFFLASAVRVEEDQFARVHRLYREACDILDVKHPPELFVAQNFVVNAAAIGVDKPFIVITSSLTDMMSDEELQCVLGHELGHVQCGHALYTTVLLLLLRMWFLFAGVPGGIYAVIAIQAALLEWSRKAELTADRAGLLVAQDPNVSYRVDMKLAGGKHAEEMNLDAFLRQAREYDGGGDMLDGVLKLGFLFRQTHPFPVLRVAELKQWAESDAFRAIMAGDYPQRGSEQERSWLEAVKDTADVYRKAANNTEDPFLASLRDLGGGAAAAGQGLYDFLRKVAGFPQPPKGD